MMAAVIRSSVSPLLCLFCSSPDRCAPLQTMTSMPALRRWPSRSRARWRSTRRTFGAAGLRSRRRHQGANGQHDQATDPLRPRVADCGGKVRWDERIVLKADDKVTGLRRRRQSRRRHRSHREEPCDPDDRRQRQHRDQSDPRPDHRGCGERLPGFDRAADDPFEPQGARRRGEVEGAHRMEPGRAARGEQEITASASRPRARWCGCSRCSSRARS